MVLNHIEQSADYVLKLKEDIEVPSARIFGPITAGQKPQGPVPQSPRVAAEQSSAQINDPILNKIKTCLEDLAETSKKFKNMLQANVEMLSSSLHTKLKALFDPLVAPGMQYVLSEDEFNHFQINDPFFLSTLIPNMDIVLQSYNETLSPTLMDMFIQQVTRFVAETTEQIVFTKRFNQVRDRIRIWIQNFFEILLRSIDWSL